MKNKVENYIRTNDLLRLDATVLVGVSGGPDSVALLHLLSELRKEWRLRIVALTIDHGLRGAESQKDVDYVKSLSKKWQVECVETYLDVPSYKERNQIGTQQAAREMRYAFFEAMMKQYNADYLALGHHGDDQSETILMRLVRSTNPLALAGMRSKRKFSSGYLIRPLFVVTKSEIESYLDDKEIVPRRDPSNQEDTYTRNYFRIHVMPHLKAKNPNLNDHLQRLSRNWLEDEMYLRNQAQTVLETAIEFQENQKKAVIQINSFTSFPFALQRRAYHLILSYLYQDFPDHIDYIHEEQFFDLLCSRNPNARMDFPAGLMLIKAYQKLIFQFPQPQSAPFHSQLKIPGRLALPDGSVIYASVEHSLAPESKNSFFIHSDGVSLPLFVRSRQAGDRMSIRGMQGSKKLKDIFIDEKVPKSDREIWPVVTNAEDRIIWLPGLKKGMEEAKKEAVEFIRLYYEKNGHI